MAKALKSDKPLNAKINKNFIILVLENPKENHVKNTKITSANKLSNFLNDEELKTKLFNEVLSNGKYKTTRLIRNRLKIVFYSK
ncbi:hypothetical protein [Flavobacterium sp. J27]|uniref:hypothetical protein n=1 Tax=Flavobacterium sp. J27 TaxID=2060419 RepID=UPI001030C24C|nr:hypothetical protein [Flavobacterium sp. J27]